MNLYREQLALLTDLYELTMAYGYWKSGRAEREAVFHLFFRKAPFQSGFTIAAGLATAIDFLKAFHFTEADLQFLALRDDEQINLAEDVLLRLWEEDEQTSV